MCYDVVLLDLQLGDGRGDDLLPIINQLDPHPAVAVVSGYLDNEIIVRLCEFRALAVPKPVEPAALRHLVKVLVDKRRFRTVVVDFARAKDTRFSEREIDVILGAVDGNGYKGTGADLGVQTSTVASYWMRIFRKTGCDTKDKVIAELFRFAVYR